jgi:hypothetical protein
MKTNPELIKSNITLEDIRPYLTRISGLFAVPFGDGGFFWSKEEIKENKESYEKRFIKLASMVLGVTEEEVSKKITRKKDSTKYWCWANNVNYNLKINETPKYGISLFISECQHPLSIGFTFSQAYKVGHFYIDENGVITQETNYPINSIQDLFDAFKSIEHEDINKQLKKMRTSEKKAEKALNTIRTKIKELENKLKD